jgi:mono/diheme cytochrome c family protein
MKIILKILKWLGLGLAILVVAFIAFVLLTWDKTYDPPVPEISASQDSSMIARGRYLVYGPAHCATCHVPMDKIKEVETVGTEFPLSGGWEFPIPPGTFRAPNLTPDMETGIGKMSDGQVARALRYNIKRDNSCLFPFMPFQDLSDYDLTAIISFLRSQPPIKHEVKPTELTFLGKAVSAFGLVKPTFPTGTPPARVTREATAEYGSYLANSIANCNGCHTERDLMTGAYIGEPFAGGFYFEPDPFSDGYSFITPNLTPHQGTGLIAGWSENDFITRFKGGRVHQGSPMPWVSFSKMDTVDLKALYRFLHSLQPVENKIDKIVFAPGEKPE